jgi:hypothetical protein
MAIKSWNEMRKLDISNHVKKRDKADYLPWASCLKLLYENGAENVVIDPQVNFNGSSLFMSEQTFTDKNGSTNRCYEVRVDVKIDDKRYTISYPVMNGINPVRDNLMNQNAVHKAQMRAFVKCVAINTGLGFDLWLDDSDTEYDSDDLSKHNLRAIQERMQMAYTNLIKKGMSTKEIADKLGTNESTINFMLTKVFDDLAHLEKDLSNL